MQIARNDLSIDSEDYTAGADYWLAPAGARKVTLDVSGGAIFVQFSEHPERGHYPEPIAHSEQRLRPGVRSRVFAQRVYSMRLRAANASSPASVSFVADG